MTRTFQIKDYFQYIITPFKIDSLLIMSAITSVGINFIESNVGISLGLFAVYFLFALIDMATGIYKNVILDKNPFSSGHFAKKVLSVGFMLLFVATATQFHYFLSGIDIPNVVVDEFQGLFIYTISLIKIFIIVGFFVYEVTSLRENFKKIGWTSLVSIIDLFLSPMIWLKNKLQKNIQNDEV